MHPQVRMAYNSPPAGQSGRGGWAIGAAPSGLWLPHSAVASDPSRRQQPGRALQFDGTDSKITMGGLSAFDFTSAFSVSLWVSAASLNAVSYLVSKYDTDKGWDLWVASNGTIYLYQRGTVLQTGESDSGVFPTDGTWHHLVAVGDINSVQLYWDGSAITTTKTGGPWGPNPATNGHLALGVRNATATFWYPGRMFDVRIYNTALTAGQVAGIYASSTPGGKPSKYLYMANLLGHWKLDDDYEDNFRDSSGNEYHGTGSGFAYPAAHYSSSAVPFSWKNEVGYTGVNGAVTDAPASDADPSEDVLGDPLEFAGPVSRDALLINSACVTNTITADQHLRSGRATTGTVSKLSLSFWVKRLTTGAASTQTIACEHYSTTNNRSWWLYWQANTDKICMETSDDGTNVQTAYSTGVVDDTDWHHVGVVFDGSDTGSEVTFYVDGASVGSDNADSTLFDAVTDFAINANINTAVGGVGGRFEAHQSLADFRMYEGVALTAADAADLAANREISSVPKHHWPMAEGDGLVCYDIRGGLDLDYLSAVAGNVWANTQDVYHHNLTKGFMGTDADAPRRPRFANPYDYKQLTTWRPTLDFDVTGDPYSGFECTFDPEQGKIVTSNVYYITPEGSALGDGSAGDPWDSVETAIAALNGVVNDAELRVSAGDYSEGENYVKGWGTTAPTFDLNLIAVGGPIIMGGGECDTANQNMYIEDCVFNVFGYAGREGFLLSGNGSRVVFNRCKFLNSGSRRGLKVTGAIEVYCVGCTADSNIADGFGYYNDGTAGNEPMVLELDCIGSNNMDGSTYTHNASTVHNSAVIIRVNGDYSGSPKVIHDVDTSQSINYGLNVHDAVLAQGEQSVVEVGWTTGHKVRFAMFGGTYAGVVKLYTAATVFVENPGWNLASVTDDAGYLDLAALTTGEAGPWHNGCETELDFTGGVATPWSAGQSFSLPEDYAYGDDLPAEMSKLTSDPSREFAFRIT